MLRLRSARLREFEQHQLDRHIREWTSLALQRDLLFSDQTVCIIPGHELNPVGRVLLGRRHVMVVAYRDTDADAILTMPECPVRLIVTTGPRPEFLIPDDTTLMSAPRPGQRIRSLLTNSRPPASCE